MRRLALYFPLFLVCYEIISMLANDAYLPALPLMQQQLHLSVMQGQLTLSAFFLGAGIGQLLLGPISDHWGRKPLLIAGVSVFIIASVACALSTNLNTLLIARLMQGATLATITVAGYAYILEAYSAKKAAITMGWMGGLLILIPAMGPLAGVGMLSTLGNWRLIFLTLAVLAIIAGTGIFSSMPHEKREKSPFQWSKVSSYYLKLIRNKPYMLRVISFSCFATMFYTWIAAAPQLITVQLNYSLSTYIWVQIAIFGSYAFATTFLLRQLLKKHAPDKLYPIGIGVGFITAILSFFISLIFNNLFITIIPLIIMGLGLSLCQWTSVKSITDLSNCPMGATMAIFCTFFNVIPAIAIWIIGHTAFQLVDITGMICFLGCLGTGCAWLAHKKIILLAESNP